MLTPIDLDVYAPLFVRGVEIAAAARRVPTDDLTGGLRQAVDVAQSAQIHLREGVCAAGCVSGSVQDQLSAPSVDQSPQHLLHATDGDQPLLERCGDHCPRLAICRSHCAASTTERAILVRGGRPMARTSRASN